VTGSDTIAGVRHGQSPDGRNEDGVLGKHRVWRDPRTAALGAATMLVAVAFQGCSPPDANDRSSAPRPRQNVILIVADDIGLESLAAYGGWNDARAWPSTPTLDRLAAGGMVFRNTWSNPSCSATRATILTGRYGFRTGVTSLVDERSRTRLPLDEVTLPQVLERLPEGPVGSAAFGKWHLANCLNGGESHPNLAGFSHFAGTMGNLVDPDDYFAWPRTVDGRTEAVRFDPADPAAGYVTSVSVDDALTWIRARDPHEPWFVYLAFHAAHWPWQVPPPELLDPATVVQLARGAPGGRPVPRTGDCGGGDTCRRATIEAMDHEIGRLLDEIEAFSPEVRARTNVIFVGDNGTPEGVAPAGSPYPRDHYKFSLFEGGINVPLIVHGPAVARPGRSDALVNTSDLFATSMEMVSGREISALLPERQLDSISLLPVLEGRSEGERRFALATAAGAKFAAVRNADCKLIRRPKGEEFFDLRSDPFEKRPLGPGPLDDAELTACRAAVSGWLDELLAPPRNPCPVLAACADCCTGPPGSACVGPQAGRPPEAGFEACVEDGETCELDDTGWSSCLMRDGSSFRCESGTVHKRKCDCAGPAGPCEPSRDGESARTSMTLVCG